MPYSLLNYTEERESRRSLSLSGWVSPCAGSCPFISATPISHARMHDALEINRRRPTDEDFRLRTPSCHGIRRTRIRKCQRPQP